MNTKIENSINYSVCLTLSRTKECCIADSFALDDYAYTMEPAPDEDCPVQMAARFISRFVSPRLC